MAGIALLASVSRVGGIVLLAAAASTDSTGDISLRRKRGTEPARRNAQREVLQAQLEAAQQAEQRAEQDLQKRADAAQLVTDALAACGLTAPTPEAAATALEQWLTNHRTYVGQLGTAQREWAELQALLNGRTLQQLNQDASSAADHARDMAVRADPALLPSINPATAAGKLAELRETARQAESKAANSSGELQPVCPVSH